MSVRLSTGLTAGLLGAHVRGGTDDHALARAADRHRRRLRRSASHSPATALANPKSSTFTEPSGVDLDIGGFQIAMDDALLVRRFQRLGYLACDGQRLGGR